MTERSFNKLYGECTPRLRTVLRKILNNESDVEDTLQNTWLKVWAARNSFNGDSSPKTWAHRIAINCAVDTLRQNKRHARSLEACTKRISARAVHDELSLTELAEQLKAVTSVDRAMLVLSALEPLT